MLQPQRKTKAPDSTQLLPILQQQASSILIIIIDHHQPAISFIKLQRHLAVRDT
jgi:hypothetical protein